MSATFADVITNASTLAYCLMNEECTDTTAFQFSAVTATWGIQTSDYLAIATLSDPSGSVLVSYEISDKRPLVRPGSVIYVAGFLKRHHSVSHSALAFATNITFVRNGEAPQPILKNLGSDDRGNPIWRPVRVSGLIREAVLSDTNDRWMHMTLCKSCQALHLAIPLNNNTPEDFYQLIGSTVSVVGIYNPQDQSNKLYQGLVFQCDGREAIRVLSPQPRNLFDSPLIERLRHQQPSVIATLGAHRVTGTVLAHWRNGHVLIRTDSGESVQIILSDSIGPSVGTTIDAAGYPESNLFNLVLSHAVWRPTENTMKHPQEEIPVELSANASSTELAALHGRTVMTEGLVTSLPDTSKGSETITLEYQGRLVNLNVSAISHLPESIVLGCRLRGVGIYLIEPDLRISSTFLPRITSSFLVIRSSADLTVTAPPKWWTNQRLFSLIVALLIGILVLATWVTLLRRIAEKRGHALAAETIAHAETDLKVIERTRLAADLHDVIAQNLTGVALELETAKRFSSDANPELQQHLAVAASSLRSCRQELRNCLWDLRSHALEEPEMDAAIRHTLPLHLKDVRFVLRFNVPRTILTDNTTHLILCVIRELAHNAIQHGKATVVKIAGCIENGKLLFSVQDNGSGFDPRRHPDGEQGHFGLEGVRERIRPLRGTFTLDSAIGKGTRAAISIPLRNPIPS